MKLLLLLILTIFISCEKEEAKDAMEENNTPAPVAKSFVAEEVEGIRLDIADYRSECNDGMDYKIEIMEDRIEVTEISFSDSECTVGGVMEFINFEVEAFYEEYTAEENDGVFIINGIEFTL